MPKCKCEGEKKFSPSVLEIQNKDCPTLFHKVLVPASMGDEETNPPKNGQYRNTLLVYEATGAAFMFSSDGVYTFLAERGEPGPAGPAGPQGEPGVPGEDGFSPSATVTQTSTGATISITDKDGTTTADVYNGQDAPVYTAGANVQINDNVISATDTTYQVFTGATSSVAGTTGLVPAPTTADVNKYLKGDGTWGEAGGGGGASRYDASWVLSGGTATQAQYDGLSAAISAGDIIYASSEGFDLLSDYYGNNNGNLSVTFTYTQIITKDGAPATMVYTMQAVVNGTTKAITTGNISTYALRMSDIPTKTSALTNDGSDGTSTYVEIDELPLLLAGVAFSGSYTDLLNTPTIPAAQIQSDWTQADNTAVDYIKNKPTIPVVNDATLTITQNGVTAGTFTANSNVGTTVALTDTTYSDFVGTDGTAAGSAGLVPAPATTDAGEYLKADGTWDTPPGVNYTAGTGIDITGATISVDTSVVAEVSDIPTKTSDLTNDGADGISTYVEAGDLATVATSGSYNDLSNKPTIPAAQVNSDWNANSGVAQILNKPTLATVATTGSYTDLSNTPTIPTVNDATLTIQTNGSQVATFTANASSNVTANISVPTATSDLTNDSGFITSITKITNAEIDAIMGVS